jgi:hypothetical protein
MGWLPIRLPAAVSGLALERGASLSGLAVAWLKRGASASKVLELGMPATFSVPDERLGAC